MKYVHFAPFIKFHPPVSMSAKSEGMDWPIASAVSPAFVGFLSVSSLLTHTTSHTCILLAFTEVSKKHKIIKYEKTILNLHEFNKKQYGS